MGNRRQFFNGLIGASLMALLPNISYSNRTVRNMGMEKILPKALRPGDTIGLIAPGYAFSQEVLEETVTLLIKLGYKPYYTDRVLQPYGYFSNTDEERAADLNHMFSNPKVDAVWCIRGGYGCTRIMRLIDYGCIRENPKLLIGFSDVTALLNGIHKETGLVTFHGPVGSTLDDDFSISAVMNVVAEKKGVTTIENASLEKSLKIKQDYERYTINSGIAKGITCGGSLTLITALMGTPDELDFTNKLVFIEDVEEAPYRMDRMLTQLIEGETFKKAAGIIFGVCAGCNETNNPKSFSLKEVILDRIKPLGIPSAYGMSFGHVKQNFTFPVGIEAEFNAYQLSLKLLEPAVR